MIYIDMFWYMLYYVAIDNKLYLKIKEPMKKKIKEICKITTGYTFRAKIENDPQGCFAVIQTINIINDTINYACLSKVNEPIKDNHILKDGDIIFRAKGVNNKAYLIANPPKNTLTSGQFMVIKGIIKDITPAYLAWCLNQKSAQQYFAANSAGNTVPNITKVALEELEIDIPPVEIQDKIVKLSNLQIQEKQIMQTLIEKKEQLISKCLENVSKTNNLKGRI